MGCVYSRVEKEETVRRCRERKRLMKQLVSCRGNFSAALLAYLQSLRNTGATLRQFTEDGSLVPGDAPFSIPFLHSPLPLPPSPPPPPPFSPDPSKGENDDDEEEEAKEVLPPPPTGEECIDIDGDENSSSTPPPPSVHSSAWEFWDPFGPLSSSASSSPNALKKDSTLSQTVEEENWAETKSEFEEEEGEVSSIGVGLPLKPVKKSPGREALVDDNSSAVSWFTKDTEMAMVLWRSKKTLAGIVKELDDYFLKASAAGTNVAALLESNRGNSLHRIFEETKRKSYKSAKVFSSLSWRWSSRSPQSSRDFHELQGTVDASSVSHCMTLDKLYSEEQRLYREIKEEETTKLQHKKKTLLLHKQEARNENWMKTEKTRTGIEELQLKIMSLQESIHRTCLSLSKLRNEELHPQLVELSSGLRLMWRTMYECHQVQNHIAQQMNHLQNQSSTEPTTDSHWHATVQLETEVTAWYNAFCNLLRSQREYVRTLNLWVRLTDCLPDGGGLGGSSSGISLLCEEWQLAFDGLPDKVAAEAIKSFLSVIHSIGLQLAEERNLQRKSERLEKRLDKELNTIREMEKKYSDNYVEDWVSSERLDSNPLSVKHVKLEAFKKRVEEEKSKYHNSVCMSRAMTLNNLQTSLPNVFQALMGFSSVCMQAFEGIHGSSEPTMGHGSCSSPL